MVKRCLSSAVSFVPASSASNRGSLTAGPIAGADAAASLWPTFPLLFQRSSRHPLILRPHAVVDPGNKLGRNLAGPLPHHPVQRAARRYTRVLVDHSLIVQ